MLTKDLLRHTKHKGRVRPLLINPKDETLLGVAQQLIDLFKASVGETRESLLESSKQVIDVSACEASIARGFEKLLLDRTEFDSAPKEELFAFRKNLFTRTSQLLAQENFLNLRAYQTRVQQEFAHSAKALGHQLYRDLPLYQQVLACKPYSAENLLHRYNCAQVQGLLIRCNSLELYVTSSQSPQLRQLCKYLRFHQLLARIQKDEYDEEEYKIIIDGPLSLFYQTQKYGLNLALFFPAILHQPEWELSAEIQLTKTKTYRLEIDDSCGIRSHYHQFLAYVPEEIEMFQQNFQNKTPDWTLEPASDFIPLEGELYCFPDYTLKHVSGKKVSMELFHAWHSSHLTMRLEQLKALSQPPLIIGVVKSLLKDPLVEEALSYSEYFEQYGFVFRQTPTIDKILPILAKITG